MIRSVLLILAVLSSSANSYSVAPDEKAERRLGSCPSGADLTVRPVPPGDKRLSSLVLKTRTIRITHTRELAGACAISLTQLAGNLVRLDNERQTFDVSSGKVVGDHPYLVRPASPLFIRHALTGPGSEHVRLAVMYDVSRWADRQRSGSRRLLAIGPRDGGWSIYEIHSPAAGQSRVLELITVSRKIVGLSFIPNPDYGGGLINALMEGGGQTRLNVGLTWSPS